MKPVDSTWYYATAWPDGRVEVHSVTLRDTGAQTLAVVGGWRRLVRFAKRVERGDVMRGDGLLPGAGYGLSGSRREALEAALERNRAALAAIEERKRSAITQGAALREALRREAVSVTRESRGMEGEYV